MIGAVRAREAHESINPISPGERVKVKGKVVDVYNKNCKTGGS